MSWENNIEGTKDYKIGGADNLRIAQVNHGMLQEKLAKQVEQYFESKNSSLAPPLPTKFSINAALVQSFDQKEFAEKKLIIANMAARFHEYKQRKKDLLLSLL